MGLLRRVVILWWRGGGGASDRVGAHAGAEKGLAVLRQLALANLSEGVLPVVVLCGEQKEDMEEAVRVATRRKEDRLHLHGTRVIFRTGNQFCSLKNLWVQVPAGPCSIS